MANPNNNPLTNAVSPTDLIRVIQEGNAGLATPRQLALGLSVPVVLAQSAVPASVTGTVAETTLATIMIPAGAMGPSGSLRIRPKVSFSASGTSKIVRVRLGGALVALTDWGSINTAVTIAALYDVHNRGAMNSQIGVSSFTTGVVGATANGFNLSAIDMTVAQSLTITGQLAAGADTLTLEAYTVEILNP